MKELTKDLKDLIEEHKWSLINHYCNYKKCNYHYYFNNFDSEVSKEQMIKDKKEIITNYIKYFPALAQNGITLDHLQEIFYTENQRTFIEDMEDHFDFKINYAYLAKYDWADIDGDICPSVTVKDLSIFLDKYHKYCIPFKVFDFNNDTHITLYISRANVVIERNDADDNYLILAR
jgi:hypothetical protein